MLRQWQIFLKKAKSDLEAAEVLLEAGADVEQVLFHLQQAVEKLLKALLSFKGIDFPKTHDLEVLSQLYRKKGLELPGYIEEFPKLTPFAVEFRYGMLEGEVPDPRQFLKMVKEFSNFVERTVKS